MKRKNLGPGFTLVEVLVVVTLIGIFMVATTQIFFTSLQTQSKSQIKQEIKQNGDYILSIMEQVTRNGQDVTGGGTNFTVTNPDGTTTVFNCAAPSIQRDGQVLTSSKVVVSNCAVVVVVPNPPTSPKYVFVNFTLRQAAATTDVRETATEYFQGTYTLRNY